MRWVMRFGTVALFIDNRIPFFRVRSSIRFDSHQVADWLEGTLAE